MSSVPDVEAAPRSTDRDLLDDVWTLFAATWAVAVLFHLAGNPTLAPVWGRGFLGASALIVLARPRQAWLAVPLAVAVLTNVWLEAPVLGNHWLLHGLVAVVVLGGVLSSGGRPSEAMARIGGPVRLTLLAFYGFAAFAKLNTDFFDPVVSCAVFYLRESADSWGALGLVDGFPASIERLVAIGVAGVELSVPVLLAIRRTRNVGVVVGLAFHYVLAFDRTHQFFDFSSVLAALFLLFLDPATVGRWFHRGRSLRSRLVSSWASGPELVRLFLLAGIAAAVVAAAGPRDWRVTAPLRELGVAVWLVYGLVLLASVVWAVRSEAGSSRPLVRRRTPSWLLLVPAVAVLNGLTPYLEVKTGYGWNMYSNLSVVDGESNHLLVRTGVPLTDVNARLVEIVETDDRSLDFYVRGAWLLPERQLLDHVADRPGVTVEGLVDNDPVTYRGGEADARPTWQQKFQVFRAVDPAGPTNCQPSFGPAR